MSYINETTTNTQSYGLYNEMGVEVPSGNDINTVQRFIRSGADINSCDSSTGNTALINAIEHGNIEIVRMLINAGANTNVITHAKKCAIISALRHPKILQYLIESGCDVNIKLSTRKTPLHFAVGSEETLEAIYILIKAKADPNAADLYGRTPLHQGIFQVKIACALMDNGANLHAKDDYGWKPLHHAYRSCNLEILKELVRRGASLHELTPIDADGGGNALHYACHHINQPGRFDLIKFLIEEHKMNINQVGAASSNMTGLTPFMCALSSQKGLEDDFTILNYLITIGANINMPVFRYPHNGSYIFNSTLSWAKSVQIPPYVLEWMIQHKAKEIN